MINDLRFKIDCWIIGLLGYLFIGLFLPTASGQIMSNKNYIIETEGVDTISGVTKATGNPDPTVSEGVNFKVRTGFGNLPSASPFSVSLSSDIVDFGTLSPTNPIIRTMDLSTNSLTAYGYSVLVFENGPLTTIPPTNK